MDNLFRAVLRIFDHEIFVGYPYFWIALIIAVIAFSPIGKNLWAFIKMLINAVVFIPCAMAGIIAIDLIYYAHVYGNPVGFFISIPFVLLSGYLFNRFRGRKFIN